MAFLRPLPLISNRGPPAPSYRWRFTVNTTRLRQCTVSLYVYNLHNLHVPTCPELNKHPHPLDSVSICSNSGAVAFPPAQYTAKNILPFTLSLFFIFIFYGSCLLKRQRKGCSSVEIIRAIASHSQEAACSRISANQITF